MGSLAHRVGSHPAGLWIIKHLISPFDRFVVKASRGRRRPPSNMELAAAGKRTVLLLNPVD
jgi:hypothetical protein